MKYWVYKESRILGPFDKEAVSGLPGLDAGTLVCAGDPAGGSWTPAGEVSELAGLPGGGSGPLDDFPSTSGLLDQLQIDSAGLIGDDEFPASLAEDLFQDASFKKDFKDILSPSANADEAESRRAREKISELTAQLEAMYRHVSNLEAAQTDLSRRLAAKDLELRSRGIEPAAQASAVPAAPAAPEGVKTFLSPAPPPIPGGPPPVAAVASSPAVEPPSEWPEAPVGGGFPSFAGDAFAPPPPAPPSEKLPAASAEPSAPDLPVIPSFASAAELPSIPPPAAPVETSAPAPKKLSFGKPHSFKIVPTKKSFKVLGAEDAAPEASSNPVPEFKVEPIAEAGPVQTPPPADMPPVPTPAPFPVVPPPPISLAPVVPPPAPVVMAPPTPAPIPVMAPMSTPEPSAVFNPFTVPSQPAAPTPVAPPPNTLSRSQPVPDLTGGDMAGSSDATAQLPPPATMARSGGAFAAAPADDAVAARFAKPEPAPPTGEIKKPGRSNKPFLIAGGVLVTLLVVLGVVFMRQPKDDLRQMTTLDDGKAPIGVTVDEGAVSPPPIVKPRIAEAPAPAPAPGPSAEHLAAIEAVKDFPLDGDRGTVGRWLQYSYTASPGAGTEEWNASTTGENTVLVEYRLVPGSSVGKGALYLFEIDGNGIVMGKNIEARQMLAGGPPPEAPKAMKKPVKKAAPKRRAVIEEPKEVPLLPLPDSGELRPPAEDDGTFGSDTINSGI